MCGFLAAFAQRFRMFLFVREIISTYMHILTGTNNILNSSGFHGSELDFQCSYRSGNLSLEGQVGV